MCTIAVALESVAKHYSNYQWVCNEVPDTVIQNDTLYSEFIATMMAELMELPSYFNSHIVEEVSPPFFYH